MHGAGAFAVVRSLDGVESKIETSVLGKTAVLGKIYTFIKILVGQKRGGKRLLCLTVVTLLQCGDLHLRVLQCPSGGGVTGMQIPYISPTGAQSKQRKLCYMSAFCCLLKNTNVSNAPPLGQQTADKSPHNPLPYPLLGVVGRDNDRRITRTILSCCPLHNIIYSVLATTCPFYTKNRCSHTPIALAVFRTKLFRTLQSRETHIGVGGLWGGRDWEEMAFFGALAKGDVSSSIALASREFLPKSCVLIKYSPLCNL